MAVKYKVAGVEPVSEGTTGQHLQAIESCFGSDCVERELRADTCLSARLASGNRRKKRAIRIMKRITRWFALYSNDR